MDIYKNKKFKISGKVITKPQLNLNDFQAKKKIRKFINRKKLGKFDHIKSTYELNTDIINVNVSSPQIIQNCYLNMNYNIKHQSPKIPEKQNNLPLFDYLSLKLTICFLEQIKNNNNFAITQNLNTFQKYFKKELNKSKNTIDFLYFDFISNLGLY